MGNIMVLAYSSRVMRFFSQSSMDKRHFVIKVYNKGNEVGEKGKATKD